jgi:hypothetical protein
VYIREDLTSGDDTENFACWRVEMLDNGHSGHCARNVQDSAYRRDNVQIRVVHDRECKLGNVLVKKG